jgi:hypothetical protein
MILVNDAYEGYPYLRGGLLDYLVDAGEFKRNQELECFK